MGHRQTRRPALVAGMFYDDDPAQLRHSIEECFLHPLGAGHVPTVAVGGPRTVTGIVCPHAGYPYSGPMMGRSFCRLAEDGAPDVVAIVAPAHFRPMGDCAVWAEGVWETPLGDVEVEGDMAAALVESHPAVAAHDLPHWGYPPAYPEHAIEVQLPFLQFLYRERTPRIVPMAVCSHHFDTLWDVGTVMGDVLKGQNAVILASCDLTHYEPHNAAKKQDRQALERITSLDAEGLMHLILRHSSLSDTLVAIVMLAACRAMGATQGEILGHATSGDIIPDRESVVGYGAAAVMRDA